MITPAVLPGEGGMNGQRHVEIEGCGPKLVVFRSRKTLTAWKRVQPNGFKSFLLAASHFSDVFVDADIGQDGDADESMGSHAAVFLDEIIVESLHDREKCGFIRDRRIARFAREEQLRINAVLILLLQPLLR